MVMLISYYYIHMNKHGPGLWPYIPGSNICLDIRIWRDREINGYESKNG